MKEISNQMYNDIIRIIPVLNDNIDLKGKSNKVVNAVRQSKLIVKHLKKTK